VLGAMTREVSDLSRPRHHHAAKESSPSGKTRGGCWRRENTPKAHPRQFATPLGHKDTCRQSGGDKRREPTAKADIRVIPQWLVKWWHTRSTSPQAAAAGNMPVRRGRSAKKVARPRRPDHPTVWGGRSTSADGGRRRIQRSPAPIDCLPQLPLESHPARSCGRRKTLPTRVVE